MTTDHLNIIVLIISIVGFLLCQMQITAIKKRQMADDLRIAEEKIRRADMSWGSVVKTHLDLRNKDLPDNGEHYTNEQIEAYKKDYLEEKRVMEEREDKNADTLSGKFKQFENIGTLSDDEILKKYSAGNIKFGPSKDHCFKVDDIGSGKIVTVSGERGRVEWLNGFGTDITWKPLLPTDPEYKPPIGDSKLVRSDGTTLHNHKWSAAIYPLKEDIGVNRKQWVEFHTCKCGAWKEILSEYEDACRVSFKVIRKSDNA